MARRNSKEYWTERAFQREHEAFLQGAELSDTLFRQYEAAARAIRRRINDFYSRYAGKYGLTYEQAVKLLNKREMQEWRADLGDYVDAINSVQDPGVRRLLTAQLDALSANSRITRLEALNAQINQILNELFAKGVEQMKAEFGDLFEESVYKAHYDLQSRYGYYNEIAKITPSMIENVVSYPWSGATFSQRLWQNIAALHFHARTILTQGLIQGLSVPEMSKALAARMGQSYKVAERLIRTESNHFHNEADKSAYEAAGVEQYEYMAGLDERTCEICGGLDGQVFDVKDAQAGTNFPPMHPNCRCTTISYDPDYELYFTESGLEPPKWTNYKEWKAKQGAGQSASGASSGAPSPGEPVGHQKDMSTDAINETLDRYEQELVHLDHEVAVVITRDGEIHRFEGTAQQVDSSALGDRIRGAYDFHNHPIKETYHSFSADDVGHFLSNELQLSRAADELYRYVMQRTEETVKATYEEVARAFDKILSTDVFDLKLRRLIDPDLDEYHEVLKRMSDRYKFRYERMLRNGH